MTAYRVKHTTTNNVPDTTGTPAGGTGKIGPDAWNADLAVTGELAITNGGTGQATAKLGRNALNVGTTTLTDAATINTDCAVDNVFKVTLGGNRTLANPTNMVAGATYIWVVTQDGTGSRTLAYGNAFTWPAGSAPTLSTAAAAVDVISALYDGTKLRSVANKAFA